MWAAKAAKVGYQWKVGDGRNIKFWEDHWFGSCSLAIQYLEAYFLVNEQNKTIADLWDGSSLKVTFRRCFDHRLMLQWLEIQQIAQTISLNNMKDSLIWMWEASRLYGVKPLSIFNVFGKLKYLQKFISSFGCSSTTSCSLEITWSRGKMLMI
jgi:hypothetical protein